MKILRVVTLASATGKYGGPFDTSVSQARLVATEYGMHATVFAGHVRGDLPALDSEPFAFVSPSVNSWVPRAGFAGVFSWSLLKELLRQTRNADVVHISFAREAVPLCAAIVAALYRRSIVLQPHGMLTARTSRMHRLLDLLVLKLYRRASLVIALTDVEKDELEAWAGTAQQPTIRILGNPLPFAANRVSEEPLDADVGSSQHAVFIARLHSRKRVGDFIEARRIAECRGWQDEYEVIGPDQGEGSLVIAASKNTSRLSYRGAVAPREIDSILRTAGVFVLTSENEPWGNVLVAALERGLPVVVTESAALAREIGKNYLGLVVPDRSPEAVASAVHAILSGSWRSPAESAHAEFFAAKRFDQETLRAALTQIYREAHENLHSAQTQQDGL